MRNQSLRQLFLMLSGTFKPSAAHLTVVPEAMPKASQGPLKGAVSVQR